MSNTEPARRASQSVSAAAYRSTVRHSPPWPWRIVQAAPRLIDYVVAHELVHLRISEHSPAFWKALAVVMPDYEERRQRLRDTGAGLEW